MGMIMTRYLAALTWIVYAAALLPENVVAQDSAGTEAIDCSSVVASVRAGPEKLVSDRAASLLSCPAEGPAALVEHWKNPPRNEHALQRLAGLSGRFQDRRVFSAVADAARRTDLPARARLHALGAMVELMDSCLAVAVVPASPELQSAEYTVMLGNVDHPSASRGTMPLARSVWQDGVAVLSQLSSSEPLTDVGKAAQKLRKLLSAGAPCP